MARRWWAGCLVLGLLGSLASQGCGSSTTVRARVVTPARVPVKAFPRIWVIRGHLAEEIRLAEALADYLSHSGRSDVHLVDIDSWEHQQQQGRVPPATVAVVVRVDMQETVKTEWGRRPETVCDAVTCYSSRRNYVYDVPVVSGVMSLIVVEATSGRVLQQVSERVRDEGRTFGFMRSRVVDELANRAGFMVDQQVREVEVELLEVDVASVEQAIELAENGDWVTARELLEDAAQSPEVERLPPVERARVMYDLGQARRFAMARADQGYASSLAAARAALERAMQLDPDDSEGVYMQAQRAVEKQMRDVKMVRDQKAAADHNFAIKPEPPLKTPEPPPGYKQ